LRSYGGGRIPLKASLMDQGNQPPQTPLGDASGPYFTV
jgi:hypothetical protein